MGIIKVPLFYATKWWGGLLAAIDKQSRGGLSSVSSQGQIEFSALGNEEERSSWDRLSAKLEMADLIWKLKTFPKLSTTEVLSP